MQESLPLLYGLIIFAVLHTIYIYARYWKYILLPYSLNFHSIFSHNTLINVRNRRTLFLDFFRNLKYIQAKNVIEQAYTQGLKRFSLLYQNLTSIDIDNYRKNKEKIVHYLGLIEQGYEVAIHPIKKKNVLLSFYKLPDFYTIDFHLFKRDKIFLGIYENGFYYRDIETLDHHLVIGESGSGKSNFMQLLNINFLHNQNLIKKIYHIDLKGGVELKRFEVLLNVEFVSNIQRLDTLLNEVIADMKQTQKDMLQKGIRTNDTFTLIIFDEFGAISSYPDKKLRDSIFQKLALISMQGRSSKHLLFMFGQKVDTTILPSNIVNNLQSRVLLKTSNDNNINIIDLKDNIRERITTTEVQDFIKGRAIYKDGLTSQKSLIQFPFISDTFIATAIKYYS
jgi:S-DNA-T family DNA segregation ATPase FtsK/SpoIIIE